MNSKQTVEAKVIDTNHQLRGWMNVDVEFHQNLPVEVIQATASTLLIRSVDTAWSGGWQPAELLRHEIKVFVGSSVEVQLKPEGGVERSQGKAKRVVDNRPR